MDQQVTRVFDGGKMSSPSHESTRELSHMTSPEFPSGRLEELQPRLQALLTDFAHLAELETADLEPLPVFGVAPVVSDRHE